MVWKEKEQNGVPAELKCPISLEVMRDPVSLSTGVTYDRASIEEWFQQGNRTCPATAQILQTQDLIPNHTLRAVIHKWCSAHISNSAASEPLADPAAVRRLVRDIDGRSSGRIEAIRAVKNLAGYERNKLWLKAEGVLDGLVRVLQRFRPDEDGEAAEEAVCAITAFPAEEVIGKKELSRVPAIRSLEWVLLNGSLESKISAAATIESVANADKSAAKEVGSMEGITDGLVGLFKRNPMCPTATRGGLRALLPLCGVVKNRERIAKSEGGVAALIEAVGGGDRSMAEAALAILEAISTTCEGRSAIVGDAMAVPTLVTSLLHVSEKATEYGVRILVGICFNSGEEEMLRYIVEMGTFEKLLLVLQMECGQRTKRYANQLLRILSSLRHNASPLHHFSSSQSHHTK